MIEAKTIKFSPPLVPLIMSGEKTCTWRLWDDKDFQKGDLVTFIKRPELTPFAHARLLSVISKTMGELNDTDREGHEHYEDEYAVYSEYYQRRVFADTPIKVLKFQIEEFL